MNTKQALTYAKSAGIEVSGRELVSAHIDGQLLVLVYRVYENTKAIRMGEPSREEVLAEIDYTDLSERQLADQVDAALVDHGWGVGLGDTVKVYRISYPYWAEVTKITPRRIKVRGKTPSTGRVWDMSFPRREVSLGRTLPTDLG